MWFLLDKIEISNIVLILRIKINYQKASLTVIQMNFKILNCLVRIWFAGQKFMIES